MTTAVGHSVVRWTDTGINLTNEAASLALKIDDYCESARRGAINSCSPLRQPVSGLSCWMLTLDPAERDPLGQCFVTFGTSRARASLRRLIH
jgi:hypothetical protein